MVLKEHMLKILQLHSIADSILQLHHCVADSLLQLHHVVDSFQNGLERTYLTFTILTTHCFNTGTLQIYRTQLHNVVNTSQTSQEKYKLQHTSHVVY